MNLCAQHLWTPGDRAIHERVTQRTRTALAFGDPKDVWLDRLGSRRGGRRAVLKYDLGAGTMNFLVDQAKPVLGPLALRATPLPTSAKLGLGGGVTSALILGLMRHRD